MTQLMAPGPALVSAMAPSKRPIVILDEKLLVMLPFVPRYEVMSNGVKQSVIPGEFLEALLNDEIILGESILLSPPIPWASARWEVNTLRNVLVAADMAGMAVRPYLTPENFIKELRERIESLPMDSRPVAQRVDLEESAAVDFADQKFAGFAQMRWVEELPIQDMVKSGESKTSGWGLMSFAAHPCFEPEDRYSSDSAFCSIAGQWFLRLSQEHFVGAVPVVRPGVLRTAGMELLWRATDQKVFMQLQNKSELRETEVMNLMGLASLLPALAKAAFQAKIKDIINRFDYADNVRKLLGKTDSVVLLNVMFLQLCQAFGLADGYSLPQLRMLDDMLAPPRLDFLDLEHSMGCLMQTK